ncbi:chemotaxis protein CheW [Magnetococcales bacterium HHB-1]
MNPLLVHFLSEARELLEDAAKGLLALEENPTHGATMNQVFRAMHTLKGASGLFTEYSAITKVVHAGEDLLDGVREGRLALNSDMMDHLLDASDLVNSWLDSIENNEKLPDGADHEGEALAKNLRAWLENPDGAAQDTQQKREQKILQSVSWLQQLPEHQRIKAFKESLESHDPLYAIQYTPDAQCFFTGDDPLHQMRQTPDIRSLRITHQNPWPATELFDAYSCNLKFQALSTAPKEELDEHFLYIADQTEITEIAPHFLILPTGDREESEILAEFVEDALVLCEDQAWDSLRKAVSSLLKTEDAALWHTSALRWIDLLLTYPTPRSVWIETLLSAMDKNEFSGWPDYTVEENGQGESDAALEILPAEKTMFLNLIQAQKEILAMPCTPDCREGRLAAVNQVLKNCFTRLNMTTQLDALKKAIEASGEACSLEPTKNLLTPLLQAETQQQSASPATMPGVGAALTKEEGRRLGRRASDREPQETRQKTLRVDQSRIDNIMDLVGELVVAKNSISYLAQRAETEHKNREMSRELKDQYSVVNRISEDLQSAVMQVRMLPVSFVFQRFPRLVRDLSRKLGKKINLVVQGENTEADKNVIEDLSDPLIHLVRNSLDHGIEMPEVRRATGKSAEGTIQLIAYQEEDKVAIEINDDGKGIDAKKVKEKALSKGLINEEQAEQMEEQEAVELILQPGFSMAPQITDLSGRGVGMDVVNSAVERAGGTLSLSSTLGKGTKVKLSLPMTMAVTRVMMIYQNNQTYGVPFEIVVETVRVNRSEIYQIKDREVVVLRGKVIPLFRLVNVLGLPPEESNQDRDLEAILIIRFKDEDVGIIVDDFAEGVDIILKKMEGIVSGLRHFGGTALLGDGSVLLVLNFKELL